MRTAPKEAFVRIPVRAPGNERLTIGMEITACSLLVAKGTNPDTRQTISTRIWATNRLPSGRIRALVTVMAGLLAQESQIRSAEWRYPNRELRRRTVVFVTRRL